MVDEFIYQFQSFQQYRGRLSNKSQEELDLLRSCDNIRSTSSVLNYLQALVSNSSIVKELTAPGTILSNRFCFSTCTASLALGNTGHWFSSPREVIEKGLGRQHSDCVFTYNTPPKRSGCKNVRPALDVP